MMLADFAYIVVNLRVNSPINIHLLLVPLWRGGFVPPLHQVLQHKQVIISCKHLTISLYILPVDHFFQVSNRLLVHFFGRNQGKQLVDLLLLVPILLYVLFVRIFLLNPCSLFSFTLHLQNGLTQPCIAVTEDYTTSYSFSIFEGSSVFMIIGDPISGIHNIKMRNHGFQHRDVLASNKIQAELSYSPSSKFDIIGRCIFDQIADFRLPPFFNLTHHCVFFYVLVVHRPSHLSQAEEIQVHGVPSTLGEGYFVLQNTTTHQRRSVYSPHCSTVCDGVDCHPCRNFQFQLRLKNSLFIDT